MKVQVSFELQVPAESGPYLELIAKAHGYVPSPGVSVTDFLMREVCEKQVSELFRGLIINSLHAQLGLSGAEQVAAVEEAYRAGHQVSAQFIES